ncbi:MAG TPA: hypothetical protein VJU13_01315 [Candidatus Nitrosocosmicus sp.]|nr:hypothetical protein [Candidatus Nitrosocosmicus sp.]
MNKIYLFAIVTIFAIASLIASTFTSAAIARSPTTTENEKGYTMNASSSNMTGENMTSGSINSTTQR